MSPTGLEGQLWQTTLEAAKAFQLSTTEQDVKRMNAALKVTYDSLFDSWVTVVLAGKIDNTKPPAVPVGYEGRMDGTGFTYPERGTQPVCAARTDIPEDHSKPQVLVLPEPDHVRNVPKGDTMPVGYVAVDSEGHRWQKQASVTPFGVAYFYLRVG